MSYKSDVAYHYEHVSPLARRVVYFFKSGVSEEYALDSRTSVDPVARCKACSISHLVCQEPETGSSHLTYMRERGDSISHGVLSPQIDGLGFQIIRFCSQKTLSCLISNMPSTDLSSGVVSLPPGLKVARIRTINLSLLQNGDQKENESLFLAAKNDGFFYLDFRDHDPEIPKVIDSIYDLAKEFYGLPLEEKLPYDVDKLSKIKING